MDRETIIKLAKECELVAGNAEHGIYLMALERFAKLVAEHIRETEFRPDWANYRQGVLDGAAEERQAIAQVVKPLDESLADEILARGQ